ncbi:phytoene/squalene synthase family protein [Pedosphaera parvula]|nr:phytoene/squalene synthase family protein [Pedosphaera parvula]
MSRTFYKTLRLLPGSIRPQIGLAYLLARMTDTIADTEIVPSEQRLKALSDLRGRILGTSKERLKFEEIAVKQGSAAERAALERCEEALKVLEDFEAEDVKRVRMVLDTITSGQELDLQRFAGASKGRIVALRVDAELDDYTYRVAGCVGEFWTKMCRAHLFPKAAIDEELLLKNGVRFGKGLQLVNILRDLPADLSHGRCYMPSERLAQIGLNPGDLLESKNETKFRQLYNEYLGVAESHLAAGWAYTNMLPKGCVRVRLACAWPILIGMQTIAKLKTENVLDPRQRIKISRAEVKQLMMRSVLAYPWPPAWKRLFPAAN